MSDCDDTVKAITCKCLAEDIPVDVVKNHDPMTCYVPYYPVFKCSGDIYFVSDCSNISREYSFDDCVSHTLDSNLNNLSNFLLYRRHHEEAVSTDVSSLYNQVSLFHHDRNTLRFLWNVNDSVVHYGMLVHLFDVLCCACASISLLHECTNSVLDVVIHNISLHLSLINDCLLSVGSTDETSNLDIKSESMLSNFCGFDPTKYFVYDPPMSRLIPNFNLSLDVAAIVSAHSQLVSNALGISWAMPLKQWLSWLNSLGSLIINTCPMLCCQFVFDNG